MINAPQSPSAKNTPSAARTVPPCPLPEACSRAIMRANAEGMPAEEKVSSTQKKGYAIWYKPIPYPPNRLVKGMRYSAPIPFAAIPPIETISALFKNDLCFIGYVRMIYRIFATHVRGDRRILLICASKIIPQSFR